MWRTFSFSLPSLSLSLPDIHDFASVFQLLYDILSSTKNQHTVYFALCKFSTQSSASRSHKPSFSVSLWGLALPGSVPAISHFYRVCGMLTTRLFASVDLHRVWYSRCKSNMATPARSLEVGGSHETPSLLVEPLLASSSSPSVRTPKDSVNYHQQPLTSSSAALSLGATAKEYPPNGSQQLHNQISDATSAQWNPQQFNIAAGHIRGFLSQHQGKVAPVPLVRSHTFPSSISPGLAPSWEATSRIESQAPPIDIQRPSSAFSSQSLDTDNIRLDKRRKTRHSSPDDEDMEHLQLRFAGHYPQHSQAGPALAQHALAQRLYPQVCHFCRHLTVLALMTWTGLFLW